MKLINYSKVRRSAATDLKKYERLGIKLFTAALKLQAKPNPSPLPMQEAYIKFYQTVFVESAKQEFNRIRQDNREKAYVPDDFFLNTWKEWIKDWVTANLGNLITGVNENTLAQIQQILGEGIEQGLNPFQLEKLLLEQIPNISRARAIARTESTRAYNEGKKRSAQDWASQTGTTLWKLWIHGGSREPRFQHIQAQDKPIRADQPFVFTTKGVEVFMDKPGDQKGGAAQTINCSCVVVYISEAYARRNFPDTFNGSAPVVRPITPLPTTTNLNPPSVTNTQLKDEFIYTTQDKATVKKVNDILSFTDGVTDLMNKNNSNLSIRTPAQSSRNGHFKFVKELGYTNINDAFLLSSKIGGGMESNTLGNCSRIGAYMNVKIKKGDVIDFKATKLSFNENEFEDLLKLGYAKGSTKNGLTNVYNLKTRDVIGFVNQDGEFKFWTVGMAMKVQTGKENLASTITHEAAHMLQALKDRDLAGWKNILQANNINPSSEALTQYGGTNFQELFAETFTAFVYDNQGLKTKRPNLYNTFVKYLEQIGVDVNTIKLAN
jgi:signal peptidase I